jgi:hypothetical protein
MEDRETSAQTTAQTYAWNWFALHSGQRLQLVNFWLIAIAFLASAFVQAEVSHLRAISFGVSVTGVVASLAFLRLDARTRQLIRVAEDALEHLERTVGGRDEAVKLVMAAASMPRSRFDSYRIIIQSLQLSVAVIFTIAAVYSLFSG